mgnify:CR=1 FL=1
MGGSNQDGLGRMCTIFPFENTHIYINIYKFNYNNGSFKNQTFIQVCAIMINGVRAYRCCCDALFLEKNLLKPLLPSLSVMDEVEEGSGDVSHAFRLKNLPGDLAGDFIWRSNGAMLELR